MAQPDPDNLEERRGGVVTWLLGILANRARKLRRIESRRLRGARPGGGGQDNVDKTLLVHYRLPPGSYTIELSDVLGRAAPPVAFTVDARDDTEHSVELALQKAEGR